MVKFLITTLLSFKFISSSGQAEHKTSLYLQVQYTHTLHDVTEGNNPWAIGTALQLFFTRNSKLQPNIELTADAYLENDKVLRLNPDGTHVNDVRGMLNLFGGGTYFLKKSINLGLNAGLSLVGGHVKFGIKPSLGFSFYEIEEVSSNFTI